MNPFFANSARISVSEKMILRNGRRRKVTLRTRYGIFVHTIEGPVLIDTGYGTQVTQGKSRSIALKLYNHLTAPTIVSEGSPEAVLASMGYGLEAVRTVIITHFHADHVAGLSEFPNARIIACRATYDAIQDKSVFANLRHGIFKELIPGDLPQRILDISSLDDTAAPLGLGHGKDLFGDGSLLAIKLPGHAGGHFGICFPQLETPLLYAVDVQWLLSAVREHRLPGFPASLVAVNSVDLAASARRVAQFDAQGGIVILCHDPEQTPFDLPETADA